MMFAAVFAIVLLAGAYAHEGHDHSDHDHSAMSSDQKVPLVVYYESYCPDSVKFYKEQLTPDYYNSFMKYVSVQFVPFGPIGKASQWYSDGSFHFKCHHGEKECYGNIVQACAIKKLSAERDVFHVISCLMTRVDTKTTDNTTYPTVQCLKKYDLDETKLDSCIKGLEGLKFLSEMGNRTADVKPSITNAPSIAVDGVVVKEAETNLKSVVCKSLKTKNLKECSSGAGTITSSVLLVAVASFLRALFH